MKKLLLSFLLIGFTSYFAIAQDVIEQREGNELKCKIMKVTSKDVQYKNFEDPEFATCKISIQKIKKIKFEDGTEKVFWTGITDKKR